MSDSMEMTSGYTDGDIDTNPTINSHLSDLIDRRYSRRETLRGGVSAAAIAVFGGAVLAACDDENDMDDDSPPVVTAGSSGNASAGRLVTLTSTVTDDGGIVTSAWTQVSGTTVTLAGATTATATFTAPAVTAGTPLVFRYTATDQSGQASSADTTVTISPAQLGFTAVAKNKNDIVTVPTGYSVGVLTRLGDPIAANVAAYANNGTDTNFAQRVGDHGDALYYYGLNAAGTRDDNSSIRGVLVQNYENLNVQYLHPAGPTAVNTGPRPEAEAIKEIEAHGVGIVEVIQGATGTWSYVQASTLNRRITPLTPMVLNGPVRGSALVRTVFSPAGTDGRGTINNCANGVTPWATNLTCEENWAGYFRRPAATDNPRRTAKEVVALTRYGVTSANGNYAWASVTPADAASTTFRKWDAQATGASATADYRNEPNQYGWCVEIDPYDPTRVPRKRTALGRMNHEGAWPGNFVVGRRPAWYMGDDAQNEYLYKFVSATPWVAADATAADRLAIGDKYLDSGTLYVAQFNADGSGAWLPLVFGQGPLTAANAVYAYADQADVLTHARLAADALGATRMDRPEWTAVNPATGEMYLTLTNNAQRTAANADAPNPRSYVDLPSTARANRNGHILRLREAGDTTEATTLTWDIYAFGAGSDLDPTNINLSGLTADNDFSSPDGLWFGRPTNASGQVTPVLWVQTDDGAFTDVTNNQMLAALPGRVGDGGTRSVTNTAADGTTRTVTTRIGAAPGTQLRRFLTGPVECEITGVDTTPDGRTLFVGIQHPGEGGTPTAPTSAWPATQGATTAPAAGTRPRSGVVFIRKNDGGVVAL